jgi:hypothetical protein
MSQRVVFLDFDGVLNGERFRQACNRDAALNLASGSLGIDAKAIALLNRIVARTSAQLVVSSSWRRQRSLIHLREELTERGLKGPLLDVTPLGGGLGRGGEIRAWLEENAVEGFVVLDDLAPSAGLEARWVQTDPIHGLTAKDCDRAIELCLSGSIWTR